MLQNDVAAPATQTDGIISPNKHLINICNSENLNTRPPRPKTSCFSGGQVDFSATCPDGQVRNCHIILCKKLNLKNHI